MREGIPWNQMEVVQDGKGHFSDRRDKTDGDLYSYTCGGDTEEL